MSSGLSISGAASGIDTASMVNQLMTVEATQQTALKTRQSSAQKAADAYSALISSLTSLADKAKDVATTSKWQGSTVTSSATSVTATASGSASGSLTFDVTSVAAAHSLVSSGAAVASTSAVVVSGGSLTVKDLDGNTKSTIDVGDGTLGEVVAAINGSNSGLRAAAVQVSPGQYKLQVTAKDTGSAKAFSLDGITGFGGGMNVVTAGADAKITIGKNPATQYSVTSATNTFNGLVPGMSVTVTKPETDVTVTATVDGAKVAADVKGLVDAANGVLSDLSKQTAYNASTKSGGALFGESTIRTLQQQILNTVAAAGAPGVSLTKTGTIAFDSDKFTTAYKADPAKVAAAFGATSSFAPATGVTGTVGYSSSTATTRAGQYDISLSVAAANEKWELDTAGGDLSGRTVVVARGSMVMSYSVPVGQSVADVVGAINTRTAALGMGVVAESSPPRILFTSYPAGAAQSYSVSLDGAAGTKTQAGTDAVGTIDGKPATATGSRLSLNDATSTANGLSVDVSNISAADVAAAGGGAVGRVTYKPGLAQSLNTLLRNATDSQDGSLARAKAGRLEDVNDLQKQIQSWDVRLEARRTALTKQFTAMETMISSLKSQTTALAGLTTSTSSS